MRLGVYEVSPPYYQKYLWLDLWKGTISCILKCVDIREVYFCNAM